MITYVEINNTRYPAIITGRLHDGDWDNRESKAITVEMSYEDAKNIFINDLQWNISQNREERVMVYDDEGNIKLDEDGNELMETVTVTDTYDNSDYSIAGDIIDHRNGKITVKMGKPTAEEMLKEMASIAAEIEYQNMLALEDVEV